MKRNARCAPKKQKINKKKRKKKENKTKKKKQRKGVKHAQAAPV